MIAFLEDLRRQKHGRRALLETVKTPLRDRDGNVNIYNVVASDEPSQPPPPAAEPAQKKPFDLKIDEIILKNASVSVSDAYQTQNGL